MQGVDTLLVDASASGQIVHFGAPSGTGHLDGDLITRSLLLKLHLDETDSLPERSSNLLIKVFRTKVKNTNVCHKLHAKCLSIH